ncbi:MAG: glycosyltransferase family 4 protein [Acidobacteriota bacterium]|nr:glycosyltransferase family 4 protein [Acidobacteriota bacterium]
MPRALMLSPELPYPLQGGGALRTASILHYLAQHHTVDLILFRHLDSQQPVASLPANLAGRVLVLELPRHRRDGLSRAIRNTGRLLRNTLPLLDRFEGFAQPIEAFLARHRYRTAVVEHFWCAPYYSTLAPYADNTVLDLHNIESALHHTTAQAASSTLERAAHLHFVRTARRLEARWLPRFTEVLTASECDSARIHHPRTIVFPNSIPLHSIPDVPEEEAIAFSGNFDYHPNQTAVAWFARHVWPELSAEHPRLVWRLIGMNPGGVRHLVSHLPRVVLVGPVADAVVELARARAVVVPLRSGSGTRLKIIEAWAAARPVVSTTLGAEGLPAAGTLLLADSPGAFLAALNRLLAASALRNELGSHARQVYEQSLTWQAAWAHLKHSSLTI